MNEIIGRVTGACCSVGWHTTVQGVATQLKGSELLIYLSYKDEAN